MCDLSGAVGAEVEEDHRVAVLDQGDRLAVFRDHCGLDKLVGFIAVIGALDRLGRAGGREALTLCQSIIGDLDTVIVVVPVHSIVTAADHGDLSDPDLLHLVLELGEEINSASGRCITAVEETVDIDPVETIAFRHFKESIQMCVVAVHTAVREKSIEMQIRPADLAVVNSGKKFRVLKEHSVLNLFGNPCQFLIDNAARAHIHMADLRIAHLSVGKTYRHPAGITFLERTLCHQLIHNRCIRHRYGICLRIIIQSVSIQDH